MCLFTTGCDALFREIVDEGEATQTAKQARQMAGKGTQTRGVEMSMSMSSNGGGGGKRNARLEVEEISLILGKDPTKGMVGQASSGEEDLQLRMRALGEHVEHEDASVVGEGVLHYQLIHSPADGEQWKQVRQRDLPENDQ